MGYPIKTSDYNWLEKTIELSEKRINLSIIDDNNYNLKLDSEVLKIFKKYSLSQTSLIFLGAFYPLAIFCMVLFHFSLSLHHFQTLGVIISAIFIVIYTVIPTYYLAKNSYPKIIKTEQGVDIKFNNKKEE